MTKRIALAAAGLLALALMPGAAHAAACASGATNGYSMKISDGTTQCVAAVVLPDGRLVQLSSPVDQSGAAITPATAAAQTVANNTLASILSAQATAALQGTANTSLASILSAVQSEAGAQATAAGQATSNTSLATIATNTAGLATAANQATLNAANGTPADAAYNGSNTASQIALLKAIFGQAPASGTAGSAPPSGASIAYVQAVPGAQPQPVVNNVGGAPVSAANPLPAQLSVGGAAVTPANPVPTTPSATEAHLGQVGGDTVVWPTSFTRPANTTAYAVGQVVANSVTAGSVTPLGFTLARKAAGTGRITRARLSSSNPAAVGVSFRLHLFKLAPTTTAGDGAAIAGAVNGVTAIKIGQFDFTMDSLAWSDGAKAIAAPTTGAYISFDAGAGSQNVYGLLEARSAYTPASGETFTVAIEADRD